MPNVDALLARIGDLPALATYLVLAAGSAIENVFPPIPADTIVLFGAFLAGTGRADPWLVLLATWSANVAGAVAVYLIAARYGLAAFTDGPGRHLLNRGQLARIAAFYGRWGSTALFFSRFLPGVRALVPVFAGVSGLRARYVVTPLAAASLLWYGAVVWLGAGTGRNWEELRALMDRAGAPLGWGAIAVIAALAVWWLRTRRDA